MIGLFFGGLVVADLLGYKGDLKEAVQVGAGHAALLDGGGAVAGQEQPVFFA